ncbi:MAG: LytTR family transcriptional regulator [Firmicutes bacterium]|nr:LytTR family transcriptional regulator [Bacillota bacterium]NBI61819.1 LytTR family transcriptional regulator [Clostridiales bacterium]
MRVEIKINASCVEPKVVIITNSMTEEIDRMVKQLSETAPQIITGSKDGKLEILEQKDLIRLYAGSGKVFAMTTHGEYALRLRLYELEERLDKGRFVRISNSEIINLKKAESFDLSLTGTICVKFSNGMRTYVSRRYVPRIKKILGV